MHRRNKVIAVLMAALAATTACASSSGSRGSAGPDKKISIAFVPKIADNAYFTATEEGGKAAAKELGGKFTYLGPAVTTGPAQVELINTLASKKVSAIAVAANDPDAIAPALKRAQQLGVKTLSFDSDAAKDARTIFVNQVTADAYGKALVETISKEMGGSGQLAIISATPTSTNQNSWLKAINTELAKPANANIQMVKLAYGNDDEQQSFTVAQGLLTQFPDLKAILAISAAALPAAARAVESAGKAGKIALTGGATPNQVKKYVMDGTITTNVLWDPVNLGYLTYYAAYNLAKGTITGKPGEKFKAGKLGEFTIGDGGEIVLGPPTLFTKENINNYNF